ncbi:hypothetical protein F0562_014232 [Nyssa sinensis]|uniref:Uncharacterized protein n=1 Tax=Nyssa sinensis TaxID=561372 RepID=A0A5J4ZN15_9ASTE|nr:hypothetical protein F0562_014232 [Nyssa sinensis]
MDVQFHELQMYYPATAIASQGEPSISIGDLQFLSYPTETISPNPLEPEPEPEPEPANNTESETETQQLNIMSEPITLELPPCDYDNMAEPFVLEHQLSPLDGSTSHHESSSVTESTVSHEPPLRILPNRTTRGVPRVSYKPVLNSTSKYPLNNYVSYYSHHDTGDEQPVNVERVDGQRRLSLSKPIKIGISNNEARWAVIRILQNSL